jgi:hypothetical protein
MSNQHNLFSPENMGKALKLKRLAANNRITANNSFCLNNFDICPFEFFCKGKRK